MLKFDSISCHKFHPRRRLLKQYFINRLPSTQYHHLPRSISLKAMKIILGEFNLHRKTNKSSSRNTFQMSILNIMCQSKLQCQAHFRHLQPIPPSYSSKRGINHEASLVPSWLGFRCEGNYVRDLGMWINHMRRPIYVKPKGR